MDFDFITNRIAVGGLIGDEDGIRQLKAAGITDVLQVDTNPDDSILMTMHPELGYRFNGTKDDGKVKPPAWFETSICFAFSVLHDPMRKLYVHCKSGINRSPSTVYAILRAFGLNQQDAFTLIDLHRPEAEMRYREDADAAIEILGY